MIRPATALAVVTLALSAPSRADDVAADRPALSDQCRAAIEHFTSAVKAFKTEDLKPSASDADAARKVAAMQSIVEQRINPADAELNAACPYSVIHQTYNTSAAIVRAKSLAKS